MLKLPTPTPKKKKKTEGKEKNPKEEKIREKLKLAETREETIIARRKMLFIHPT